MKRLLISVVMVMASAATARAEATAATEAETESNSEPVGLSFASVGRLDGATGATVQFGLLTTTEFDVAALHFAPFYQHYGPNGFGAYGGIPVTLVMGSGDSAGGVGNPELGIAYARRKNELGYALRLGSTIPLGSDGDGALANLVGAYTRPQDLVLAAPQTTWLRMSASAMLYSKAMLARLDLGFDVPVHGVDETFVNFGIGVSGHGDTAPRAEVAVVSGAGESLTTLSVGLGLGRGAYVNLATPLSNGRFELFMVTIGFRTGVESPEPQPLAGEPPASGPPGTVPDKRRETNAVCEQWKQQLAEAKSVSEKMGLIKKRPSECRD